MGKAFFYMFVAVITLMTFCDDVFLDEPGSCLSARFNYYIPRRQTTPPPGAPAPPNTPPPPPPGGGGGGGYAGRGGGVGGKLQ